ncbi:480_t:CDS:10 [Ambispora leptoticha]|uniref:480_t:CDS:1 n=1 Tax=Ambispora leptoticha TaxID=144679 RepID=A0A9N8Z443_9GLOM|nr:480_t:CDS:10 [Ambispora leptoticha]
MASQTPQLKVQTPAKLDDKPGKLGLSTNKKLFWKEEGKKTSITVSLYDIHKLFVSKPDKLPQKLKIFYPDKSPDKKSQEITLIFELTAKNAKIELEKIKEDWVAVQQQPKNTANASNAVSTSSAPSPASGASTPSRIRKAPPPLSAEDIEQRKKLLEGNEDLRFLHKEMVFNGPIPEEDFWEQRQHLLRDQKAKDEQKKGRPSKIPDLQTTTEEGGEVKITINSSIINSIFEQYPSVHRAYMEKVPDVISESEFWKRYYGSKFFHRNRSGKNQTKDDIFDALYQEDEEELIHGPKRLKTGNAHVPTLIDLSLTEEDHIETGNSPDLTMRPGQAKNLPILRRFNRHGARVLKSIKASNSGKSKTEDYKNDIVIEELYQPKTAERVLLDIKDQTKYFQTYEKTIQNSNGTESNRVEVSTNAVKSLSNKMKSWRPDLRNLSFDAQNAAQVTTILNEKIKAKNEENARAMEIRSQKLPSELEVEIKKIYSTGKEFLRHYWSAAVGDKNNIVNTGKREKMYQQIQKTLEKLQELTDQAAATEDEDDASQVENMLISTKIALQHAVKDYERSQGIGEGGSIGGVGSNQKLLPYQLN